MLPRPRIATIALAGALALIGCAEAPAQPILEQPSDALPAGTATAILNAGVMTQMGQNNTVKFLFDPLYDDHFGSLEQLSPELIEAIVTGAPPYDGVDAVFVSHAHGDHFSASQITRMLSLQSQIHLVAPQQAIDRMREDALWDDRFAERITAITLENGEASERLMLSGAEIEAFRSPHTGWPDRHFDTHNITYRVSAASGEGSVGTIMHLGDADPAAQHYFALADFLAAKRTGLAMVPFWFYQEEGLGPLLEETLNAQMPVAIHVPVRVPGYLSEGHLPYFSGVGEVLEIPATQPAIQ